MTSSFLQQRVEEILDWYPELSLKGEGDISGVGLEKSVALLRNWIS